MAEEKKELTLGREITKEITGDVCGLGAGILVGGLLNAAVDAIPGIGKPLKLLLKMGVWGIEIATMFNIKEEVEDYVTNVFEAVDGLKELFGGPKKENDINVQVEGAVE